MQFAPKKESEINKFENLPEGDYPFTVLESGIQISKSAKNAGKEMVRLKISVHGKDFDRHVYDYFADWFSEWKLKHFCETAGLARNYAAGDVRPESDGWKDRTGMVRITIEDDPKYGEKNSVDDYLPSEEQKVESLATPKPAVPAPVPSEEDDVPF